MDVRLSRRPFWLLIATVVAVAAGLAAGRLAGLHAAESSAVITGTVVSRNGPEAGVWVIAEADLQTKFRKIVVTTDDGRFLLPDLPPGWYRIWVRGYGLVDSKPVTAGPGRNLKLAAVVAPTPRDAAQVYPASYWVALVQPPSPDHFPGTGPSGNGISPAMRRFSDWMNNFKGCERCHQLGTKITRQIPPGDLATFGSSLSAWDHRVRMGQRGGQMSSYLNTFPRAHGLKVLSDWTDAIAAGAVPPAPARPRGIERNVVLTMWNIATPTSLVHDVVATDRRNPRLNPYGKVYGVDIGMDLLTVVDPVKNTSVNVDVPTRDEASTITAREFPVTGFEAFRFWGPRVVWKNVAGPHNPMFDATGRVWMTTAIRGPKNPAWCADPAANPFAAYFPLPTGGKQTGYYDTKTGTFVLIDTCVRTHHLQFAEDTDSTLYFSTPGGESVGWLNTRVWDETHDEQKANGWCPIVVDTNGDGRITKPWNEPGGPRDPARDTRVAIGSYGVIASPVDGALWGTPDEYPGRIFRLQKGTHPPDTCVSEVYEIPVERGYRSRGIDIDREGVVWVALGGSASFGSFDRRRCRVLNGPAATGRHCDEGWKFYPLPGVTYKGSNVGTDFYYYNYVDQFNTLGLGANIPIATGSNSDSLIALNPASGESVVLRVPYPLGFYPRGMDGRIDDPKAGWKGRGVYSAYGADAHWHIEGGPVERGNLVKFQIRPDPLAR